MGTSGDGLQRLLEEVWRPRRQRALLGASESEAVLQGGGKKQRSCTAAEEAISMEGRDPQDPQQDPGGSHGGYKRRGGKRSTGGKSPAKRILRSLR
ncbi:UNVERIFIED_CONTAM: hypothetical protein K2H54_070120 [Gekko kuhli]